MITVHPATLRRIADQLAAVSSREVSPAIYQSAMQHAADELRGLIGEPSAAERRVRWLRAVEGGVCA
jgi:hypothetical protein